tara:strand:- start:7425 stop:8081 length:657 start_codon:yes stop_codon:yes gene_type:complete
MIRSGAIFAITALFLTACGSTPKPAPIAMEKVTVPGVNQVATAFLGERMIITGYGYYTDTLTIPTFDAYAADFTHAKYYRSPNSDTFMAKGEPVTINNGYGSPLSTQSWVKFTPGKDDICVGVMNCYSATEMGAVYSAEKEFLAKPDSFQQAIEYNGKSGTTLKFTYREFKDDMARGTFTTDFTIDLDDGKVFGYKGSRFEVISANNSRIEYKLLAPF